MKEIVEVIAKAIVDNPNEVVVTEREEGRSLYSGRGRGRTRHSLQ